MAPARATRRPVARSAPAPARRLAPIGEGSAANTAGDHHNLVEGAHVEQRHVQPVLVGPPGFHTDLGVRAAGRLQAQAEVAAPGV